MSKLSVILDESNGDVVALARLLLQKAAQWFDIMENDVEIDYGYHECVDVEEGLLTVCLARFKTSDLPFEAVERMGAKFIANTKALDTLPAEIELLRRAYSVIMGD